MHSCLGLELWSQCLTQQSLLSHHTVVSTDLTSYFLSSNFSSSFFSAFLHLITCLCGVIMQTVCGLGKITRVRRLMSQPTSTCSLICSSGWLLSPRQCSVHYSNLDKSAFISESQRVTTVRLYLVAGLSYCLITTIWLLLLVSARACFFPSTLINCFVRLEF